MAALNMFSLAAGLKANFRKSKFLPLKVKDWHSLLWPGMLISSKEIVRHLGYPLAWHTSSTKQAEWVMQRIRQKIHYWKLSTWPLHVRLRIVQSVLIAYIQFFLPLLHWPKHQIDIFMLEIMEHFWRTQSCKKGLRLLSLSKICTPKKNGGLNILNIHVHALVRKATLLPTFILQYQPWSQMMAFMSSKIKTSSYGNWHFLAWEVTFGKVQGYILRCPYTSHLLSDWKLVTKHAVWRGQPGPQGNSLRIENLPISPIPPLLQDQRYLDWLVMGVPLMQITAKHVYSKMQPSP